MSIDSPRFQNSAGEAYSLYPSFFLDDSGGREMPVDVNPDGRRINRSFIIKSYFKSLHGVKDMSQAMQQ